MSTSRNRSQISPAFGCSLHGPALGETLDGGQCFRWNRSGDGVWLGVSGACAAEVHETPAGTKTRVLAGTSEDLHRHLAADIDWPAIADQLPWRTDAHLARCIAAFPGLRILRQPIGEALLCFLCSAAKQIAQIKQMAELLAARFGKPLPLHPSTCSRVPAPDCHPIDDSRPDRPSSDATQPRASSNPIGYPTPGPVGDSEAVHALPTWEELAVVDEAKLRDCKLGFRARHVHAVARRLAEQPGWLTTTAALPYAEAKARLLTLPGVGEKIADCVLLFGAGKLEAFPVDVWILRSLARRYGLTGWQPAQVAQFGRAHFGPLAGLAQQFLFAWERRHGTIDAEG